MTVAVHNALDDAFRSTRAAGRAALIPYLTAGFPDPDRFVELALAVIEAGADALEIGIPFSDPLLDGPSIQRSQQAALDAGITPQRSLSYADEIHRRSQTPLLFMGAYNPIFAFGLDRFCGDAARAGVTGLIVPDLPVEESEPLRTAAGSNEMHVISMVAPTSPPDRMARVCVSASGFVYGISVAGVTGARTGVAGAARPLVERVRKCTDVPVAVGFGIGNPQTASEVGEFADGVIVGTALIDLIADAPPSDTIRQASNFVASLRVALE